MSSKLTCTGATSSIYPKRRRCHLFLKCHMIADPIDQVLRYTIKVEYFPFPGLRRLILSLQYTNGSHIPSPIIERGYVTSISEPGRVYASGLNKFGQLGISDDNSYIVEPVEIYGLKKEVKQISAG